MTTHPNQPRDLYRCLGEYPLVMLQALAATWGVSIAIDLPSLINQLVEAMQNKLINERVLASCGEQAHQAIAVLLANPAGVPSHRLVVNFGQIRKLGPAGLVREAPWASPASPLEELYYKGLVFRAYGYADGEYGEILWMPQELASLMPAPSEPDAEPFSPEQVRVNGRNLSEDVLAVLIQTRLNRYQELSALWKNQSFTGRLANAAEPDYILFLESIIKRTRLLTQSEGYLRPANKARGWMRSPYLRQLAALFIAWRDNPGHVELAASGVRIEGGKTPQLVQARRNLCSILTSYLPGKWYSLDKFITRLQLVRPDYLRENGDYESWVVSQSGASQPIRGYASWPIVEGSLARYMLLKPLYWLGIISLGCSSTAEPAFFQLSQAGSDLLAGHWQTQQPAISTPAISEDDFTIRVPIKDTLYERYQLERFSIWQEQGTNATYRITEDSVWRGINAGIKVEQMIRFLDRLCAGHLSPTVRKALQVWSSRFGRASLHRVVIFQTQDAAVMSQLTQNPQIKRLLGPALSSTQCIVMAANVEQLIEQLKAIGIWPTLKL